MFNEEEHKKYLENLFQYKTDYTIKALEESGFKKKENGYIGDESSFLKLDEKFKKYLGYKKEDKGDMVYLSNFASILIIMLKKDQNYIVISTKME